MATVKQAIIKNTRQLALANKADSTVTTNGEILMLTAGLAVPATSSTVRADLLGVCNQSIAAAEALTQVPYIVPSDEDVYIFSTTNNSDATHNGQAMVLGANSTTVNNTGTTSATGIIQQVAPLGAAADKLILGRFLTL
jgi:predicted RecA/RadA family phage recombinase